MHRGTCWTGIVCREPPTPGGMIPTGAIERCGDLNEPCGDLNEPCGDLNEPMLNEPMLGDCDAIIVGDPTGMAGPSLNPRAALLGAPGGGLVCNRTEAFPPAETSALEESLLLYLVVTATAVEGQKY